MTPSELPFLDDLRTHLVAAVARRRRRRRAALAVALPTLLALGLAGGITAQPDPALAVEREGNWIVLRIEDAEASAEQMSAELAEAGVDAEVRVVPAAPERSGRWACVAELPGAV